MKCKLLLSLAFGCALSLSAQQGYKDGIEYYRADKLDDAKILLERTFNDASTNKSEADYYLGMIALKQNNIEEATKYFNEGIKANPANGFNYVGLGAVELKKGNKKAAEDKFKEAKNIDKKNAVMLVDIARAYYTADPAAYSKEIQSYIKDAKNVDKKNPTPAAFILEADIFADEGNIGDAAGYYEMAFSADTKNEFPEAYVKYAQAHVKVNPTYSINKLKELLDKNPNSALAQRELAEKYYDNNQLTRAAQEYGKYIQNPNHFQKDEQRYVGLLNFAKEYQQSFDLAQDILRRDPGNIYMERMLFLNQAAMGNNDNALEYARQFFANPQGAGNYVANDYSTYGEVLFANGDTVSAIQAYETALELQPNNMDRIKDLSSIYSDAKQYAKSAEVFQQYVDKDPNVSVNDKFTLARRYNNASATATDSIQKIEYADKALAYIDEVLAAVPDNFSVANQKALTMYTRNNSQMNDDIVDAFMYAIGILDQDPANQTSHKNDYARAYTLIGNYYNNQGRTDEAKEIFYKYLAIDPDNEALRNYVEKLK